MACNRRCGDPTDRWLPAADHGGFASGSSVSSLLMRAFEFERALPSAALCELGELRLLLSNLAGSHISMCASVAAHSARSTLRSSSSCSCTAGFPPKSLPFLRSCRSKPRLSSLPEASPRRKRYAPPLRSSALCAPAREKKDVHFLGSTHEI